jgi:branched-chain amino acid transport system substrate-binding protein
MLEHTIHRPIHRRGLIAGAATAPLLGHRARAKDVDTIRVGVLTDAAGPYADSGGPGSMVAARMAAADFGGTVLGRKIEIVLGDTQNKPDVASSIARQWYDTGHVDAITDLPVTPVAAAVLQVAREKQRTVLITASAVSEFTTKLCAPISTHWADDTNALTTTTAKEVVAQGGKSWFFLTVDFTFGKALETAATAVIERNGGKVLGSAYFPIGNSDFSSQLVQAQASGAQVIGLAAVGNDQVNAIKQTAEFGLTKDLRQRLASFLVYITDIHSLGLQATQGLLLTSSFYWDQNEKARVFSRHFYAARNAMPTRNQASIYTATLHFLKSMAQAGTRDALAVNKAMRALPVDYHGHPGTVRADGRVMYYLTLYRVKSPAQSKAAWDYYMPVSNIAAVEAFLPMNPACVG